MLALGMIVIPVRRIGLAEPPHGGLAHLRQGHAVNARRLDHGRGGAGPLNLPDFRQVLAIAEGSGIQPLRVANANPIQSPKQDRTASIEPRP